MLAAADFELLLFRALLSLLLVFSPGFTIASSTGPVAGASGVPAAGDTPAEITCIACHVDYPLDPDSLGHIKLSGLPVKYVPGRTYTLTLEVGHPEAQRWGFQLTAVAGTDLHGAGDFAPLPGDHMTQRVGDGVLGRVYIEHGAIGRATGVGHMGGFSWQFSWTAPKNDEGDVTFYGVFNAANGDGSNGGDKIYAPPGGILAICRG